MFKPTGSFCSNAPSARTVTGKSVMIWELDERSRASTDIGGMVSVEGFIAGEKRFDQPSQTVKYLLFTGFTNKRGDCR